MLPVIEVLNTWNGCFNKLASQLLQLRFPKAREAAQRIILHRKHVSANKPGKVCIVDLPNTKSFKFNLSMEWLPEDNAVYILTQQEKHNDFIRDRE